MLQAVQSAVLLVFPALVIFGAVQDAVSYRIPNWISLALIAGFALAAVVGFAAGLSAAVVGLNVAVGAGALLLGIGLFTAGWVGGGDAKLFAAGALWLGWPALVTYLAATALAGGGLALLLYGLRSTFVRPFVSTGPAWLARLAEPGENVPYGVAIAVGALAAFPGSSLAKAVWAL
jgi:prepilin peptidase CpaA